jgi:hypothetical protein
LVHCGRVRGFGVGSPQRGIVPESSGDGADGNVDWRHSRSTLSMKAGAAPARSTGLEENGQCDSW